MASPQVENGHIKIANEIWEVLTVTALTDAERRVVMAVIRKTWGWKIKEQSISTPDLCEATKLLERTVRRAVDSLVKRRIVLHTPATGRTPAKFSFNKDWEQWDRVDTDVHPDGERREDANVHSTERGREDTDVHPNDGGHGCPVDTDVHSIGQECPLKLSRMSTQTAPIPLQTKEHESPKATSKATSKATIRTSSSKTQISPDWKPGEKLISECSRKFPGVNLEFAAEEFVDYWLGVGKAMKDWDATFRNRIRTLSTRASPRKQKPETSASLERVLNDPRWETNHEPGKLAAKSGSVG